MPKLQGLIFDLEGTLIDGVIDVHRSLNEMLIFHKRRPLSLEETRHMAGEGLLVLMQRALETTGTFEAENEMGYFKQFIERYRAIEPDPAQVYPHVREQLDSFRDLNIKMGVCTNKPERSTRKVLEALNLMPYFSSVAGGDTYQVHKPNPEHLLGVISDLHVPVEASVMIGDGPRDVSAAHGAKVPCIVVTQGEELEADGWGADKVITNFSELPGVLKAWGYC